MVISWFLIKSFLHFRWGILTLANPSPTVALETPSWTAPDLGVLRRRRAPRSSNRSTWSTEITWPRRWKIPKRKSWQPPDDPVLCRQRKTLLRRSFIEKKIKRLFEKRKERKRRWRKRCRPTPPSVTTAAVVDRPLWGVAIPPNRSAISDKTFLPSSSRRRFSTSSSRRPSTRWRRTRH